MINKTRHGKGKPSGIQLADYQLGFDDTGKDLYIKQPALEGEWDAEFVYLGGKTISGNVVYKDFIDKALATTPYTIIHNDETHDSGSPSGGNKIVQDITASIENNKLKVIKTLIDSAGTKVDKYETYYSFATIKELLSIDKFIKNLYINQDDGDKTATITRVSQDDTEWKIKLESEDDELPITVSHDETGKITTVTLDATGKLNADDDIINGLHGESITDNNGDLIYQITYTTVSGGEDTIDINISELTGAENFLLKTPFLGPGNATYTRDISIAPVPNQDGVVTINKTLRNVFDNHSSEWYLNVSGGDIYAELQTDTGIAQTYGLKITVPALSDKLDKTFVNDIMNPGQTGANNGIVQDITYNLLSYPDDNDESAEAELIRTAGAGLDLSGDYSYLNLKKTVIHPDNNNKEVYSGIIPVITPEVFESELNTLESLIETSALYVVDEYEPQNSGNPGDSLTYLVPPTGDFFTLRNIEDKVGIRIIVKNDNHRVGTEQPNKNEAWLYIRTKENSVNVWKQVQIIESVITEYTGGNNINITNHTVSLDSSYDDNFLNTGNLNNGSSYTLGNISGTVLRFYNAKTPSTPKFSINLDGFILDEGTWDA